MFILKFKNVLLMTILAGMVVMSNSCSEKDLNNPETYTPPNGRTYSCVLENDEYVHLNVPQAYASQDTSGATWCDTVYIEWGCLGGFVFVEFDAEGGIVAAACDSLLGALGANSQILTEFEMEFAEAYQSGLQHCDSEEYECFAQSFADGATVAFSMSPYYECFSCSGSQYNELIVPDSSQVSEEYSGELICFKRGFTFEPEGQEPFIDTIFIKVDTTLDKVAFLGVGDQLFDTYFEADETYLVDLNDTLWNSIMHPANPYGTPYFNCKSECRAESGSTAHPKSWLGRQFCRIGCRLELMSYQIQGKEWEYEEL